jgi:hypothetical protein
MAEIARRSLHSFSDTPSLTRRLESLAKNSRTSFSPRRAGAAAEPGKSRRLTFLSIAAPEAASFVARPARKPGIARQRLQDYSGMAYGVHENCRKMG